MHLFPLPIFPEGSLRGSVVTTIWVGVFVISFFNLRFGWTYSGLVVPGYLVPLILTNPLCAGITLFEGICAYALVKLVSDYMSRLGGWCDLFGRDRFFALFLSGVLVRVIMDGWVLPAFGAWLQLHWNLTLDYKGAFHSFGLIILALIANQFWKAGLWRGLPVLAATTGVTFLLVRGVLMTVTNFNIGHVAYMYSDAAASLLASPKSYIILIVTGLVASRMNLRYGWEYNGILIPALLALQWYEPLKIVSSFAEAAVVYIVSDLLLQSPMFRNVTMENARKLLLFFNVAYAYRLFLGYVVPLIFPGAEVNDYFGFAYLLSSLMALKMHGKHIVLRLSRATLQTSFFAAVAANLLGLWLAWLLGSLPLNNKQPDTAMGPLRTSSESVEMLAEREKVRLFRKRATASVTMPTPGELNWFQQALELIQKHAETGARNPLELARRYLSLLHYRVELIEPRLLCLREQEPNRGWGFFVIDLNQPNGLLVEVPAPLDEWSAMESGVDLYHQLHASTLAIAGGSRIANRDGSSDVLANPYTPFQAFHRVFGRRNVLQVRGYTDESGPRLPGSAKESALFVKSELPRSLSLKALESNIGDFRVFWKPAPLANAQQRITRAGFAELWLNRPSRIQLKSELAESLPGVHQQPIPATSLLLEWLLEQKRLFAKQGSGIYIPALPEEMLYFDEEILTPLLELAQTGCRPAGLTPEGERLVQAINCSGWPLGYTLCFRHDVSLNEDFLVLTESPQASPKRYWGTFVLRLGNTRPYTVQVPRPLFDMNSLECGVYLFEQLQAESLLLASCHNAANQDQAADVLDFRNAVNLFSLVNQVVMRQAKTQPMMAVQCRGYAAPPGMVGPPEVMLAFRNGVRNEPTLTPLGQKLVASLKADGIRLQYVDGSPMAAGYEVSGVPQAHYVNETTNKEFAIVWLSPTVREVFRPQDQEYPLQVQLEALNIPITRADLKTTLDGYLGSARKTRLPPELKRVLDQYVATMDIVSLQRAVKEWPRFEFSGLYDRNSQQVLLLISEDRSSFPVVLNLQPRQTQVPAEPVDEAERIQSFLASRSPWLEWPL